MHLQLLVKFLDPELSNYLGNVSSVFFLSSVFQENEYQVHLNQNMLTKNSAAFG